MIRYHIRSPTIALAMGGLADPCFFGRAYAKSGTGAAAGFFRVPENPVDIIIILDTPNGE